MAKSVAAGIEYHGIAGSSHDCDAAVMRLVQGGAHLTRARILTCGRDHALLLTTPIGDQIAIKSGFASGYGGAGPSAFSFVLAVLASHGVEIDECEIPKAMLARLDRSALTLKDLDHCATSPPIRPSRWSDYVAERDFLRGESGGLFRQFPSVIPFVIIDPRLGDLARDFWNRPDHSLTVGYRRLEDIVRQRTGLPHSSQKLFQMAFDATHGKLTWDVPDRSERVGRMQLFTGAFGAYRNPRQHREHPESDFLAEFLLLNQLYRLEAETVLFNEATALDDDRAT
jgi:hypothetical protein